VLAVVPGRAGREREGAPGKNVMKEKRAIRGGKKGK